MTGILYWLRFEEAALLIFGIFFLVDAIPAIYLHIEYLSKNIGEQYEINSDSIIRYRNNQSQIYYDEDIDKVIIYKSASMDKGGIPFLAVESYCYARIVLKSGDDMIFTRLLYPDIEKAVKKLHGVKFERRKRLFNTVFWR